MTAASQKILDTLAGIDSRFIDLDGRLSVHIAEGVDTNKKTDLMYKVVVVDNGNPSLITKVNRNTDWITNANKLGWIIITAIIGQFVVTTCSIMALVLVMLVQYGSLK